MKRFLILVLFFVFVLPVNALEFDIKSTNAILYNYNLDEVIYEKNSNEKVKIASLTKIMTTTVAIENIDNLNEEVTITYEMLKGLIEENASVVGYRIGDRITYKDLLYGSLLPSGADATRALAISIAGSEEEYVKLMNKKAKELNMNNTIFTNSSGLDTNNQYSTVSDVLILLKYALQNETFKEIYTTFKYKDLNSTLNKLLNNYNIQNKYIKGAKTGYTDLAGYCLSSYSNDNNIEYLLITTGVYSIVRNPVYSAVLLMCTGAICMANNLVLFFIPVICWIYITIFLKLTEEKWLVNLYGQEYIEYCKRVNRCIPWFPRHK